MSAQTGENQSKACDLFLETRSHLRPKSIIAYRLALSGLKKVAGDDLMLAYLQTSHVKSFIDARTSRGKEVSADTKNHRFRHIAVFIHWALDEGHLKRDPLVDVKLPKRMRALPTFLTPEELDRVLAAIDADYEMKRVEKQTTTEKILWLKDLILVAVSTGMRLGELCSLRWQDVDFSSGFLYIKNRDSFQTKSENERAIPLVGDGRRVLERRQSEREDAIDGFALSYPDVRPIVGNYASKRFKYYSRLAGLPERIKFHSLRHTCASWLVMQGVSPAIVQQILGHRDLSTTMRYSHLAPNVMKQAMELTFE